MALEHVQHRPGNLKQPNKAHKHGRHRSKGSIERLNKGQTTDFKVPGKKKLEARRDERKHQAVQHRQKKRAEYLQKRREMTEAPFLVAVIPLRSSIDTLTVLSSLKSSDDEGIVKEVTVEGHHHVHLPRLKHKFTFVPSNKENLFDTLDLLKVVDSVLFLTSVEGIDEDGSLLLTAALAQGVPSTLTVCVDLDTLHLKKRQDAKTAIEKELEKWLPEEKVYGLEKNGDGLMVFRRISNQKQKKVYFRDNRPHLLAETAHFIETSVGKGTLQLTGYLHGQTLNVNSLVHIPGWGDFQMSQIDFLPEPFDENSGEISVLEVADPEKQWSLQSENIPDPMDAEQTWPTEEEIAAAEEERKLKKVKKIPKGWTDYHAAWIPDDDAIFLSEDEQTEDDDEDKMDAASVKSSAGEDDEEMDTMTEMSEPPIPEEKYDQEVDAAEEAAALQKIKEAAEDKEFPDEVDTPVNIPARQRFQRYRGLASFRTSPWNPKENLPYDYAKIFQFQNFSRTRLHALKQQEEFSGAMPGWYIRVHVKDVPMYLYQYRSEQPIALFGLLEHEQKMSVVNMVLKRSALLGGSDNPIKSKENLVFHCGYRRYRAKPVFSQHTKGNKFKYERFFQPEAIVMATVFAPVIFPPAPVLVFKECHDGTSELVAIGRVHSVDPNRVIVKRVVLSGHPFKINKKSAVIRFMFHNREDINWFKPVELHTKYGRRGHIKEPLGTHGHMKCVFNGQLKSQDTILLNLYKRVFPKWTYEPKITFTRIIDPDSEKMDCDKVEEGTLCK